MNDRSGVTARREVPVGYPKLVEHDGTGLFEGLPSPMFAARYHSLTATRIPEQLRVTARSGDLVMAVEHSCSPIVGMQFHPESILTPSGGELISAAMRWAAGWHCRKPEGL